MELKNIVVHFTDSDDYCNIEAKEFHEDGDYLKAYGEHNELVGIFRTEFVKEMHISKKGVKE